MSQTPDTQQALIVTTNREGDRPWLRWRPILAILSLGLALYAFYLYSQTQRPIDFGVFRSPPLYGYWEPTLDSLALFVLPAACLLVLVSWWFTLRDRAPTWLGIALLVVSGVALAAAVGLVRGDPTLLTRGVTTDPSPFYTADLHLIDEFGVRGFVERHPEMTAEFQAYASKTHPPGPHLFLYALFRLFGDSNRLLISTAVAAVSFLAAVAAWTIGEVLAGERAGRIGAILFVAAPGPLLLAYTSMDAVFSVVLSMAAALFMLAMKRQSILTTAIAGSVLAIGALMTFAAAFVAAAAAIALLVKMRPIKQAAAHLGAATAGGLGVLVVASLALGFDLIASLQSVPQTGWPYELYWVAAGPAALLIWAGLPVGALGLMGLTSRSSGSRPILPLVLFAIMLVWVALPSSFTKLRPGEVERTWAFLYPLLAGVAGSVVHRWSRFSPTRASSLVVVLVLVSIGQAVLLQALWDTIH